MNKILLVTFLFMLSFHLANSQSVSIPSVNTAVTQDFNTLANSGTSSIMPNGWYISESGSNANATYSTGTGSGNSGDTYSFGIAASNDRTIGGLQSGSLIPTWGASFTNNTGVAITSLVISYTGKTWRVGTANRVDRIDFQYSIDATSLTTGTFKDEDNLDYSNPGQALGSGTIQHSSNISYKIVNLNIVAGATFWLKFNDFNASGADDGMGIDDFSITANPPITEPTLNFNPASLAFGNQSINTSSAPTLYAINYTLLDGSPLTLTTSAPFKISETLGGNYNNNLVLNGLSGSGTKNIYVSFNPIATGNFNSNISHDGAGLASSTILSISGTGVDPNATSFAFENCTPSGSATLSDGFTQFSVTGAQTWACTSFGRNPTDPTLSQGNALQISGFASGNIENEDWLISPVFNLTSTNFPILSFWTRSAFNGNKLQLKISTDYIGTGNPNAATWTNLDGKFPTSASDVWTNSDNISLSSFKTNGVYVALVYTSTNSAASRWTLDDLAITNSSTPPAVETNPSTNSINFGYLLENTSTEKNFTFSSANLTGDVFLNASGDFLLSKTSGGTFSNTLNYTNATVNNSTQTVYVKFNPTQANKTFTGNINITTSGTSDKTVILNGNSFITSYSLEVCNWNIEWFGSTVSGEGPSNVTQQAANVRTIVNSIDADIYGFAEVVDTALFRSQVLPAGYNVIFNDFGSYADDKNDPDYNGTQKLAFMYKTDIIKPIATYGVLRDTYYPSNLMNNGVGTPFKNWASGRFPFLMEANVVMNGVTEKVYFIEIHAKANTGTTASQIDAYNRRKGGADQLKTWIDTNLPGKQVIIVGDYNDVLNADKTIAPSGAGPGTSYSAFTTSSIYNPISLSLSLAGKKSTTGFPTVIDNAIISNSLNDNYISGSVDVLDDRASLVTNYSTTTTDHYPILSRYFFDATTLPIQLGGFNAYADGNKAIIKWTTISEKNNDYFLVERSTNGKDFETVAKIKGAGDSNALLNYQITDDQPLSGTNYYRLKQIDFNGTSSYSNVKAVNIISGKELGLSIYPNPIENEVYIQYNSKSDAVKFKLFDLSGKIIYKSIGNVDTIRRYLNQNLPNLSSGTYIIELNDYGKVFREKIIKK